jgi:hypothetical protein
MSALLNEQINHLDSLDDATLNALLDDYASGAKTSEVARKAGVSARGFWAWLRARPEMQREWHEAQKAQAQEHAEQSVVEAQEGTFVDAAIVGQRVKARQWLAARRDPEAFGTKPKENTALGPLFLSAMERINAIDTKDREAKMLQANSVAHVDTDPEPDFETVEREPTIEELL